MGVSVGNVVQDIATT